MPGHSTRWAGCRGAPRRPPARRRPRPRAPSRLLDERPAPDREVGLDEGGAELGEVVVDADDDDPPRRERPVAVRRPARSRRRRGRTGRRGRRRARRRSGRGGPRVACRRPTASSAGRSSSSTIGGQDLGDDVRTRGVPGRLLRARRRRPSASETTARSSTATPCARANPSAAFVGPPSASKATGDRRADGLDLEVVLHVGQVAAEENETAGRGVNRQRSAEPRLGESARPGRRSRSSRRLREDAGRDLLGQDLEQELSHVGLLRLGAGGSGAGALRKEREAERLARRDVGLRAAARRGRARA